MIAEKLPFLRAFGSVYTVHDLPQPDEKRWTPQRKALLVLAVQKGLMSKDECLMKYRLSERDFEIWETDMKTYGLSGMKTTQIQKRSTHRKV